MQKTTSRRLIANTLSPRQRDAAPVMRRTLDHAVPAPQPNRKTVGRPADRYRIADRALDHVVNRLLEAWRPTQRSTMQRARPLLAVIGGIVSVTFAADAASHGPGMVSPLIRGHGAVIYTPDAPAQPRRGAKAVYDVMAASPDDKPNPGLEAAARLLNLYGAAGMKGADVRIAVVLHGDATRSVLSDAAYSAKFGRPNPSTSLMRELRSADVEIDVCRQALHAAGFTPGDVSPDVVPALSATTALIEKESDGYAYLLVK